VADAACYVISNAEWRMFTRLLAQLFLLVPVVWVIATTDWQYWLDRLRLHGRRRRLRAIRESRR